MSSLVDYTCHGILHVMDPRFLSCVPPYDVARIMSLALARDTGRGASRGGG